MTTSMLIGYVRKSRTGQTMNMSISVDAFNECGRYTAQDGTEFVRLIVLTNRLDKVITGQKEITGISHMVDPTEEDDTETNTKMAKVGLQHALAVAMENMDAGDVRQVVELALG